MYSSKTIATNILLPKSSDFKKLLDAKVFMVVLMKEGSLAIFGILGLLGRIVGN